MGFVVQISANDHRIIFVVSCQHLPIGDPARLWIGGGIPERRLRASVGTVTVKDDVQTNLAGVADDLIHNLQSIQPLEIRIFKEVNAVRCAASIQELVGVG